MGGLDFVPPATAAGRVIRIAVFETGREADTVAGVELVRPSVRKEVFQSRSDAEVFEPDFVAGGFAGGFVGVILAENEMPTELIETCLRTERAAGTGAGPELRVQKSHSREHFFVDTARERRLAL